MNADEWQGIPGRLKAAGFTVSYERVSYAPENPLWRARAHREEREWITFGRALETALTELERQTLELVADWRGAISAAASGIARAESAGAN